jgi:hypothetical protein
MFGYTLGYTSPALPGMMAVNSLSNGKFKPKIFTDLKCTCVKTAIHDHSLTCKDDNGGG